MNLLIGILSAALFPLGSFADPAPLDDVNAQLREINAKREVVSKEIDDLQAQKEQLLKDKTTFDNDGTPTEPWTGDIDQKIASRKKELEALNQKEKDLKPPPCSYTPPGTGVTPPIIERTGPGTGPSKCKEGETKPLSSTITLGGPIQGLNNVVVIPRGVRGLDKSTIDQILSDASDGITLFQLLGKAKDNIGKGLKKVVLDLLKSKKGGTSSGDASDAMLDALKNWSNQNHLSGHPGEFTIIVDGWTASWKKRISQMQVCTNGNWIAKSNTEITDKICTKNQEISSINFTTSTPDGNTLDDLTTGTSSPYRGWDPFRVATILALERGAQNRNFGQCEAQLP